MQASARTSDKPWDAVPEPILPSSANVPPPVNPVGPWQTKIKINFSACRGYGMSNGAISLLHDGADLSLMKVPSAAELIPNYASLMESGELDKAEAQLESMASVGYLEFVEKPGLGFVPMGLVPKPPPPPDPITGICPPCDGVGRIISDLTASGLNAWRRMH